MIIFRHNIWQLSETIVMSSTQVNLIFFISFLLKLFVIFVFPSQCYLLTRWSKSCVSWLNKSDGYQNKLSFSPKIIRCYNFYCLKIGKRQQWDAKKQLLIYIANKDEGSRDFGVSFFYIRIAIKIKKRNAYFLREIWWWENL